MNVWRTLGLPQGSDRDTIRRAYAQKLRTVHPEDDAEGFQALREAYEIATHYASLSDDPSGPLRDHSAADEPVEQAHLSEPPRDPQPIPDSESAFSERQEESGRTADSKAFEEQLARFAELLDPGHANAGDPGLLNEALDAISASPMLAEIQVRLGIEDWLAQRIASTIPLSDPVIERCVAFFEWEAQEGLATGHPAVDHILRRREEWRYAAFCAQADSPLHQGWRALSSGPLPRWRYRADAFRPGVAGQVSVILNTASRGMQGLQHYFQPERLTWWLDYFSKPRLMLGTLLIPVLVLFLAMEVVSSLALGPGQAILFFAASLVLALASPVLYLRLVKRAQFDWETGERPVPPTWIREGWMAAAGALPIIVMLLPANPAGFAAAVGLSLLVALWAVTMEPIGLPLQGGWARALYFLKRLWMPLLVYTITKAGVGGIRGGQWAAAAAAMMTVWLRGRDAMAHALALRVRRYRMAVATAAVIGTIALSFLLSRLLPATPPFYFAALCLLLFWPIFQLFALIEPEANKFPLILCWVLFSVFYGASMPPPTPNAAKPPSYSPAPSVPLADASDWRGPAYDPSPRRPWPESVQEKEPSSATLPPWETAVQPPEVLASQRYSPAPKTSRAVTVTATRRAAIVCPQAEEPELGKIRPAIACGISSWFVSADYPVEAARGGVEGTARVRMDVDKEGDLTGCTLEQTSGSAALDRATCDVIRKRARFLPARNEIGEAIPAVIAFTMDWQLRE